MPDDTLKVKRLLKLADDFTWTNLNSAQSFASRALKLSEELNYTWGLAYSKYTLSSLLKDSDLKITEDLILEALEHARTINDSILIGRICNTIGNLKDNVNETDDAVKYDHLNWDSGEQAGLCEHLPQSGSQCRQCACQ